jgi:prepilin-type N-terminal cleavage/methylation domain-containing protein
VRADVRRDTAGFSMIELTITVALFAVVLTTILQVLTTSDQVLARAQARSNTNDQARLAIEQIDRQVRSGNLLYDPASESNSALGISPGLGLRIYTQANSLQRCVQWRVLNQKLQTRAWTTTWATDGNVGTWRTVVTGVTNTTATPAFSLATGSSGRTLNVDLLVNTIGSDAGTTEIKSAVTGRNTQYGYPSSVCSSVPS